MASARSNSRVPKWPISRLLGPLFSATPRRSRLWLTAGMAVIAYLAAAYASTELMGNAISPDFTNAYHPGALGIQRGDGFVMSEGTLITRFPPGFSFFISPWVQEDAQRSLDSLRHVAGVLAVLWVGLLSFLITSLLPRVSLFVALPLVVLWPSLLALGNPTTAEQLFTVLETAAVCVVVGCLRLEKRSWLFGVAVAVAAGCLLAAMTYVRTQGFAVTGAVLIAIALGSSRLALRRKVVTGICVALSFLLLILPWAEVVRAHTGHFRFTSVGPSAMSYGVQRSPSFPFTDELLRRSSGWQTTGDAWRDFWALSREDPAGAVRLVGFKFVSPWFVTFAGRFDRILMVLQLPVGLLFVAASVRVLGRWRRTPGEIVLLHGVVCSLWVTSMLVVPLFRYLAPSFPLAIMVLLWHASDLYEGAPLLLERA